MTLKQSLHILAEKERDKKTCSAGDKCSTSKKMLMPVVHRPRFVLFVLFVAVRGQKRGSV